MNQATESRERIDAAYRVRALRLAGAEGLHRSAAEGMQVLVFRSARERYAIELSELSEVLALGSCVPAPEALPQFRGVINVRGEIRTVVDFNRLLTPGESGGDPGYVLMLRRPGREIGLKVDRVEELRKILPEELDTSASGKYVKGTVSGALMLLSVDAVLAEVFPKRSI